MDVAATLSTLPKNILNKLAWNEFQPTLFSGNETAVVK